MALQQQPPGVVLGGERPIMPVVSMGGVGVNVAALQMNQVQQPQMQTVQQLQLPVHDSLLDNNNRLFNCDNKLIEMMQYRPVLQTLNPTIIGNQLVGGTAVQALPIAPSQPVDAQQPPPAPTPAPPVQQQQPQQMDTNSAGDSARGQDDCALMPPPPVPPPSSTNSNDEKKDASRDDNVSTPMDTSGTLFISLFIIYLFVSFSYRLIAYKFL